MDMAAILVMWPGPFEQSVVASSHGGSICNLASTGPVISEEKRMSTHTYLPTDDLRLRWAQNESHNKQLTFYAVKMISFILFRWAVYPAKCTLASSNAPLYVDYLNNPPGTYYHSEFITNIIRIHVNLKCGVQNTKISGNQYKAKEWCHWLSVYTSRYRRQENSARVIPQL